MPRERVSPAATLRPAGLADAEFTFQVPIAPRLWRPRRLATLLCVAARRVGRNVSPPTAAGGRCWECAHWWQKPKSGKHRHKLAPTRP